MQRLYCFIFILFGIILLFSPSAFTQQYLTPTIQMEKGLGQMMIDKGKKMIEEGEILILEGTIRKNKEHRITMGKALLKKGRETMRKGAMKIHEAEMKMNNQTKKEKREHAITALLDRYAGK
jgi:hypothetical protein